MGKKLFMQSAEPWHCSWQAVRARSSGAEMQVLERFTAQSKHSARASMTPHKPQHDELCPRCLGQGSACISTRDSSAIDIKTPHYCHDRKTL